MTRRRVIILLLGVAMVALAFAVAARRVAGQREAIDAARRRLAATQVELGTVRRLGGERERVSLRQRPTEGLIVQVTAALDVAKVPKSKFEGLAAEGDAPVSGSTAGGGEGNANEVRKQSVRLSLREMNLPELGAFLQEWRRSDAGWTPTRIELTRRSGGDDRYDANITMSAVYRAAPPAGARTR